MKKIRYYTRVDGLTQRSINALPHVARLGRIRLVRAYRIELKKKGMAGVKHEYVMVYGEHGTARFSGFCWGYGGSGPCGLVQLLEKCGLCNAAAIQVAFKSPRFDSVGDDWEVRFDGDEYGEYGGGEFAWSVFSRASGEVASVAA